MIVKDITVYLISSFAYFGVFYISEIKDVKPLIVIAVFIVYIWAIQICYSFILGEKMYIGLWVIKKSYNIHLRQAFFLLGVVFVVLIFLSMVDIGYLKSIWVKQ